MIKILKYSSITLLFFFTGCLFYSPINEEVSAEFKINSTNNSIVGRQVLLAYIPSTSKKLDLTWNIEKKPEYSELKVLQADNNINLRAFIPDVPGIYEISLKVEDEYGASDKYSKSITVKNNPPIAIITSLNSYNEFVTNKELKFSGLNSYDEDHNLLISYEWNIVDKPYTSDLTIEASKAKTLSITPDSIGNYSIKLKVVDSNGLSNYTTFSFYVHENSPPKIISTSPSSDISLITIKQSEKKEFFATVLDDSTEVSDLAFTWDISINDEEFFLLSNSPKLNFNPDIYGIGDLLSLNLTITDNSNNEVVINWRLIIIE